MKKLMTLILALMCTLLISTQGTINIKAEDEIDGLDNNLSENVNVDPATETLDFVNDSTKAINKLNEYKTGKEKSTWDANNKILTLKGVNIISSAKDVILLPPNSTISVEGINTIGGANNVDSDCNIIKVSDSGDLNISKLNKNTASALNIITTQSGTPVYNTKAISVNGNLNINDGCSLNLNTTNGCINCAGNLTVGDALVYGANANGNVECAYITGDFKTTSEYSYVRFVQNTNTAPNKPAVYATSYTPFKDTSIAEEQSSGSTFDAPISDLVFADNTFLSNGDHSKKAANISIFYAIKYTINLKANNGVELYKDSTKIDESNWPYYFYKKGNDNVVYINNFGQLCSTASTSALYVGKGVKISGGSDLGSLNIEHYSDDNVSNGVVAEDKLELDRASLSIMGVYSKAEAGAEHNAIKANSIQLAANCKLSARVSSEKANGIKAKSIRIEQSSMSVSYSVNSSTNAAAILIDNPDSVKPIQIIGDSNIGLGGTTDTGTPETLYIKTDKTIEEIEGSFALINKGPGQFEDMLWKKTADGYHYEEKQSFNANTSKVMILKQPSPTQTFSGDMPYSNNAFHGNVIVHQADDLTARVGGAVYQFKPATVTITNKTTSYDLKMGQDKDFLPSTNPSLAFTLNKSYLDSLELGTYDLEIKYPIATKTFTFNIKLNVTNKQSPVDPGKKDESCEKVIGPTWHWNNDKGICEDVGVVGTATR